MNRLILLSVFICCIEYSKAQPITFFHLSQGDTIHHVSNGFGSIDILANCDETWEWEFLPQSDTLKFFRGMAYSSDGTLLILHLDFDNLGGVDYKLSKVDFSRKSIEVIDSFPRLFIPPNIADTPSGLYSFPKMKIDPDNNIYISDVFLKKYNISEKKLTHVGMPGIDGVPARWIESSTFINGELYVSMHHDNASSVIIVKVNLDDILNSSLILSADRTIIRITEMTTINYDCDSSVTILTTSLSRSLGARFYQLDLENSSIIPICNKPELFVPALSHPTEAIRYDCVPILDLNEPDSFGIAGLDYQSDTICIAPNRSAFPLGSGFPEIITNTVVDSIWIGITDGATDGSKEWIDCTSNCFNSGKGILFKNSGREANKIFLEEIKQSLFYKNTAPSATAGMRQIAFVTFKKSYRSDTSYLWMPVVPGPDAGDNGEITVCRDANPIDLFEQLGGVPMQGGIWSFGDGIFDPETDQSGIFQYTVQGAFCAAKTASVNVIVNELPLFSLGADVVLCSGKSGRLEPSRTGNAYEWQDGSSTKTLDINTDGEYWLELTDSLGCQSRDTVLVTTADHVQKDSLVRGCSGDFFTFQGLDFTKDTTVCVLKNSSSGCDSTFCLTIRFNPNYSETVKATICEDDFYNFYGESYARSGIYNKQFVTANACDSLEILELNVLPLPTVIIEGDTEICYPSTIELSTQQNYASYLWSSGSTDPKITAKAGAHKVTVIDENGCFGSSEILIQYEKCDHAYIPSAFSPNGDFINDEFQVYTNSYVELSSMKVFDRWGNQVFDGGENDFWDGTWQGKNMPSGVYVYFIELVLPNGRLIIEKGDVSLMR